MQWKILEIHRSEMFKWSSWLLRINFRQVSLRLTTTFEAPHSWLLQTFDFGFILEEWNMAMFTWWKEIFLNFNKDRSRNEITTVFGQQMKENPPNGISFDCCQTALRIARISFHNLWIANILPAIADLVSKKYIASRVEIRWKMIEGSWFFIGNYQKSLFMGFSSCLKGWQTFCAVIEAFKISFKGPSWHSFLEFDLKYFSHVKDVVKWNCFLCVEFDNSLNFLQLVEQFSEHKLVSG